MERVMESRSGGFIQGCIATSAATTAVASATTVAYFIFQGIRDTKIDNMLGASHRALRGMLRSIFSMDPVVAAWAVPLVLGAIGIAGWFVYRHFNK